MLNGIHAMIEDPMCWLAEGEIVIDDGLKVGCFEITTLKPIETPGWYNDFDTFRDIMLKHNHEFEPNRACLVIRAQ